MPQELTDKKVVDQEKPWEKRWRMIKQRCGARSRSYYRRGIKNILSKDDVMKLWIRDKASFMNVPTIDRIDTSDSYYFDNCRFIEMKDNVKRTTCRRDGMFVQQIGMNGNVIATYLNCAEASRKTKICCDCIRVYLRGGCSHAGGYKWSLIKPTDHLRKQLVEEQQMNGHI